MVCKNTLSNYLIGKERTAHFFIKQDLPVLLVYFTSAALFGYFKGLEPEISCNARFCGIRNVSVIYWQQRGGEARKLEW